jgi:hypothetical protein
MLNSGEVCIPLLPACLPHACHKIRT